MSADQELAALNRAILDCTRCPRLTAYCAAIAREKRKSYRDETYHGRPVPNFGDPHARILIVGLAPGAHGANRTGRMFTGDRSGDFLYGVLHAAGLASQPESKSKDDGLALRDCFITAAIHCAPPDNKPAPDEIDHCAPYLDRTFDELSAADSAKSDAPPGIRVIVVLGRLAFDQVLRLYQRRGWIARRAGYDFAHGKVHHFDSANESGDSRSHTAAAPPIICSFHPSQQNTFTGRLTVPMLRDVFDQARTLAGLS